MKYVILVLCGMLTIFSCSQDENKPAKSGNISFSLSQKARTGSRIMDTATPAALLISVKDDKGNLVYENKKLVLLTFGQGYMSESLKLNTGNYSLTQFIVLDASGNSIYATPLEGSALASEVADPLPINFSVTENGSNTVTPQVVAVTQQDTPDSFGYASFGFEIVTNYTIEFPLPNVTIDKVTLSFQNNAETVTAAIISPKSKLSFSSDELVGKKWKTTIIAWYHSDSCYQEIDRYKGEVDLTATKSTAIPILSDSSWHKYYYSEYVQGADKIQIYRSQDYKNLSVEVALSSGLGVSYGYADEAGWNNNWDLLCDMTYTIIDSQAKKSSPIITKVLYCNPPLATTTYVDDLVVMDVIGFGHVEDYFAWTLDGKPYCTKALKAGRSANHRPGKMTN